MAQRDTVQGPCEWYLIASRGVGAVRVRPGMLIGETAEGELSFDPSCAQVELDIADDGDLLLNAVGDNELESTENARCSQERVPRHRRAEVHLQNNILRLNTDFLDPTLADDAVEIRTIAATPDTAPHIGWFAEGLADDTADAMAAPPRAPRPAGAPLRDDTWGGGSAIHRQRFLGVVMLTLAGLVVVVGFALLYPSLQDVEEPLPTPVAGSEPIGPDPATTGTITRAAPAEPEPTTARSRQGAGVLPATVPQPTLSPAPEPRATRPGSDDIVVRRGEGVPDSGGAVVIAPIPLPNVAHRSMPEVTRPRASEPPPPSEQSRPEPQVTQTRPAPVAVPPPVAVDRRPDPALVAELERIGAAASRMTAEMARDRDLRAADLAFAQGHLTTPPDASAYLLYSRVLEVDPGSTEAARGLQSVRQGLINRAMAQIAGNTLDDARRSLQAAEEAGANPMLVADLLAEVDYRQRAMSSEPDGSRR